MHGGLELLTDSDPTAIDPPMKSRFPGMDPYLETHWESVHQQLIVYASDSLQPQLPDDLRARVGERVFVETERERIRRIVPDVHVSRVYPRSTVPPTVLKEGGAAVA